ARGAAERDAGGRIRGAAGSDPRPPRADQTRDIGATEARQFDRSIRTATRRECDWLTSPNGPEDSDDVQLKAAEKKAARKFGCTTIILRLTLMPGRGGSRRRPPASTSFFKGRRPSGS